MTLDHLLRQSVGLSFALGAGLAVSGAAAQTPPHTYTQEYHVCAAGINFGQAASREFFFGRASPGGQLAADQVGPIHVNLDNAKAHIDAAESLFPGVQPPERGAAVATVPAQIETFKRDRARFDYNWRAQAVGSIAHRYRNTLNYTYVSFSPARSDQFQRKENCISHLFLACYHFGYASTAAAATDFQATAISTAGMRNEINAALAIAMDGDPFNPAVPKICCNFGLDARGSARPLWGPMLSMNATSPHAEFVDKTRTLLQIANAIVNPPSDRQCHGRSWPHPDRSARVSPQPGQPPIQPPIQPPPRPPTVAQPPWPPSPTPPPTPPRPADDRWVVFYVVDGWTCCLGDGGYRAPHPINQGANEVPRSMGIATERNLAADAKRQPLSQERFNSEAAARQWACAHAFYSHARSGAIARINGVLVTSSTCRPNR